MEQVSTLTASLQHSSWESIPIERIGARHYKTYRLYQAPVATAV